MVAARLCGKIQPELCRRPDLNGTENNRRSHRQSRWLDGFYNQIKINARLIPNVLLYWRFVGCFGRSFSFVQRMTGRPIWRPVVLRRGALASVMKHQAGSA
jgi:hypothetical protein